MARNKWMSFFDEYSTTGLTTAQLRQAEKSLAKMTNQRLVRLEQAGLTEKTSVIRTLEKRMERLNILTDKNRISTREIDRNETIRAINAMREFLKTEQSTPAGLEKVKAEARDTFAANFDISINDAGKLADAFRFASEEANKRYFVDSNTVAIAKNSAGMTKRQYLRTLRNYGYEIKDQKSREFYYTFAEKVLSAYGGQ